MKLSLWLAGIILTTTCALTFVLLLDAEAFREFTRRRKTGRRREDTVGDLLA